ncbi:MAG: hypothetical protein FWE76_01980 [Symbiobacteriaceae bacterium]|nr:hypothetical protein [Symbiobacteriaceae bacterium]
MLTPTVENTLKAIYDFGGYATTEMLCAWRPEVSRSYQAKVLQILTLEKYLVTRPNLRYGNMPKVYQVTGKTCALYGNPNSYRKSVHNETYVRRSLLRSLFLFRLVGSGYPYEDILASNEDRVNLLQQMAVQPAGLPAKMIYGERSIQIEEYILRKSPGSGGEGLTILHTHKPGFSPRKQLYSLCERYAEISETLDPPPSVYVVCEHEGDAAAYLRAAKNRSGSITSNIEVCSLGADLNTAQKQQKSGSNL